MVTLILKYPPSVQNIKIVKLNPSNVSEKKQEEETKMKKNAKIFFNWKYVNKLNNQ